MRLTPYLDTYDLWQRWLKRVWRPWRRRWEDWCDHRAALRRELQELTRRMNRVSGEFESDAFRAAVRDAIAKSVLSSMSGDVKDELLTHVRAELLVSCKREAVEIARREQADELARHKERLDDQLARHKTLVEEEAEAQIEAGVSRVLRQQQEDWEAEIRQARSQRTAARQERDQAMALLVELTKQVFGPGKVYAYSRGVVDLDLVALNAVLAPKGLRVRAQLTDSTRLVRIKVDLSGRTESRSVFWVEAFNPADEAPEDDTMPDPLVAHEVPSGLV